VEAGKGLAGWLSSRAPGAWCPRFGVYFICDFFFTSIFIGSRNLQFSLLHCLWFWYGTVVQIRGYSFLEGLALLIWQTLYVGSCIACRIISQFQIHGKLQAE
jgi:hypothetical protein